MDVREFVDARVVQIRGVEVPVGADGERGDADRHDALERLDEEVARRRGVLAGIQGVEVEAVAREIRLLERIDAGENPSGGEREGTSVPARTHTQAGDL